MYVGKVDGIELRLRNEYYENSKERFRRKHAKLNEDGDEYVIKRSCLPCKRIGADCKRCCFRLLAGGGLGCLRAIEVVAGHAFYTAIDIGDERITWDVEDDEIIKKGFRKIQKALKKFKRR